MTETDFQPTASSAKAGYSTHAYQESPTNGLWHPGDTASYKVFVVLNTGNESRSNTVTISRP